jgi:hypothetical protein
MMKCGFVFGPSSFVKPSENKLQACIMSTHNSPEQKDRLMHTRDEIKRLTELASCAG